MTPIHQTQSGHVECESTTACLVNILYSGLCCQQDDCMGNVDLNIHVQQNNSNSDVTEKLGHVIKGKIT